MFAIAPVALAPLIAVGYEVAGSGWEKGLVDGGIYSALLGFMAWRDEKRPRHARSSRQVDVVAAALAWFLFGGFTLLVLWGFSLAPRSTALLVAAALVAVAAYGGWRVWRDIGDRA
jgi:hypothetical protein